MTDMRKVAESTQNVLVVCDDQERLTVETVESLSDWIDDRLDDLVQRWRHLAAPNAALREIFGKPR
jgi:hypothetical protein